VATDALRPHREYWLKRLSGDISPLALPLDRPRQSEQQFSGGQITLHLAAEQHSLVQRCCREQRVTLFMLLVTALKVVLHQLSGAEDILVGSPIANREPHELEGQIGNYLDTVVLRDRIHRVEPFPALLQRVRTTVSEAFSHRLYPFDSLVEDLA